MIKNLLWKIKIAQRTFVTFTTYMSDLIRKNETINCVSQISSSQISASGLLHGPTRGVFFGDPDPPRTNFVGLEAHEVDRGAPEMDPICRPVVFNLYL